MTTSTLPRAAPTGAGRTSRFRRGAAASLVAQVLRALSQVVLVPVFLGAWGEALYGEWLTLSALAAQMGLVDFGVQTYVLNRLGQCRARGEQSESVRVLHSALCGCLVLAGVAVAVAALLAFALPLESWFQLSLAGSTTTAAVAALLALQIGAQLPYGLVTGIYRTLDEFPRGMAVYNADRLLHTTATAACLLAGGGLVHVAVAQLLPLGACLAWVLADLRRRHPEVPVGLARGDARLALSFLGPSSLFFAIRASQAASMQGSALFAGALFGPSAVALFVTLRTLCNAVRQVANSFVNALWPELTALEARGDLETLRRVHAFAVKVVAAASLAAALVLHHAGAELAELWTSGELSYSQPLMDALLLLLVLQAPWTTSSIFLVATNRHRPVAAGYALASVLGLALAWPLAARFGLPGLVLGLLAGELCVPAWLVPRATCELLHERPMQFAARALLPLAPIGAAVWFVSGAVARVTRDALPGVGLVAVGASVAALVPALTWLAWLDPWERERALGLLVPFDRNRKRRS